VIGPNGSGKTTLLNVISGVLAPSAGSVSMGGRRIAGLPSHRIAQEGIARTFQNIRLFRGMTVTENVETAAAWSPRARGLLRARRATAEVIDFLGLEGHANRLVETLAYGIQRRVEVARAIVTRPSFLLLDEPAAGLNEIESDSMLETIFRIQDFVGCGIVLIDHDLHLIMRAAARIHVLSEGRTLAQGTPTEIRHDQAVIEAYLGSRHGDGGGETR
jgi:ABC-type branched-subunit amino acid transport system ATPase component